MARKPYDAPRWFENVEEQNFPAAESYLGLIWLPKKVRKLVVALRVAKPSRFKAKTSSVLPACPCSESATIGSRRSD
jgi:hypothetical protein